MIGQGEFRLVEALVEDLQSYPTLTELTGHQLGELHIGAYSPQVTANTPFLSVRVHATFPMNSSAPTSGLRRSEIEICAHTKDDLDSVHIIDYVESLVLGTQSSNSKNRRFWDFSNSYIQTRMTTFLKRRILEPIDGLTDTWESKIMIEVIWIDEPCEDICAPKIPRLVDGDTFDCSTNC